MSKKASRKKQAAGKRNMEADFKPFIIKPIPTPNKKPLIGKPKPSYGSYDINGFKSFLIASETQWVEKKLSSL